MKTLLSLTVVLLSVFAGAAVAEDGPDLAALEQRANEGDARAMIALANELTKDKRDDERMAKAVVWYRRAAEKGEGEAHVELARHLLYGWGVPRDPDGALKHFREAAKKNQAAGVNGIGFIHEAGLGGVEQDLDEARRLYEKAAEMGYAKAFANLGRLYESGSGVKADMAKAFGYYSQAAEKGVDYAQDRLALMYEFGNGVATDKAKAFALFQKAAEQGHIAGQFNLGRCYVKGIGTEVNHRKAATWFEKGAEGGDAASQFWLGRLHQVGDVRRDYERARKLYELAAAKGYAFANDGLGSLYFFGHGVKRDLKQALAYYLKAKDAGLAATWNMLGKILSRGGDGVEKDEKQAAMWFEKAAGAGHVMGRLNAGTAYLRGIGVKQDLIEAYAWFSLAAAQGNADATAERDKLEEVLSAEDLQRAKDRARVLAAGTAGGASK